MLTAALLLLSTQTAPPTGQALLDSLSQKAVRYFWEQTHPVTGLTKDRASNFEKPDKHEVASVAACGYALSAWAVGVHRGWLPKKEAVKRSTAMLAWLNKHGLKEHGWFFHFVNWKNGERVWNCESSSIDTGLLLAGAIMAEQEYNDAGFSKEFKRTMDAIDWKWMLTNGGKMPNATTLCMGWGPEHGFINARWDGLYESSFLNLIALGASKDVPDKLWKDIRRTPVKESNGRQYIIAGSGTIFIHQMSQEFVNMKGMRDNLGYDYWVEGRNNALAQRQYCIDNPKGFKGYGANFWGLNAGDAPSGYVGNGVPDGPDDGTVSPTGAIATVMYDKEMAMEVANHLAKDFPETYGIYGFSNGINPSKDWHGPDVIGIDLGMCLLAIEDARDGLPHKLAAKSKIYQLGLKRAGFHKTEEGPLEDRPLQKM